MNDENVKKDEAPQDLNIVNIDDARVKRLAKRGHMMSMLEEYEILRLKVIYDKPLSKADVTRFVTLCKYFMAHGPSEPFKLSCKLMYEKYMEPFGL